LFVSGRLGATVEEATCDGVLNLGPVLIPQVTIALEDAAIIEDDEGNTRSAIEGDSPAHDLFAFTGAEESLELVPQLRERVGLLDAAAA